MEASGCREPSLRGCGAQVEEACCGLHEVFCFPAVFFLRRAVSWSPARVAGGRCAPRSRLARSSSPATATTVVPAQDRRTGRTAAIAGGDGDAAAGGLATASPCVSALEQPLAAVSVLVPQHQPKVHGAPHIRVDLLSPWDSHVAPAETSPKTGLVGTPTSTADTSSPKAPRTPRSLTSSGSSTVAQGSPISSDRGAKASGSTGLGRWLRSPDFDLPQMGRDGALGSPRLAPSGCKGRALVPGACGSSESGTISIRAELGSEGETCPRAATRAAQSSLASRGISRWQCVALRPTSKLCQGLMALPEEGGTPCVRINLLLEGGPGREGTTGQTRSGTKVVPCC